MRKLPRKFRVCFHLNQTRSSGKFSARIWGDDAPQNIVFEPLKEPIPKATWAECKDGLLYVTDQTGTPFERFILPGKNYHGLDYPLFHMDIRNNVEKRTRAFLQKALTDGPASAPQE